jgi:hypothetical protein
MRMGVVRTDLNRIYLADVENTSQRNFSSQPPGQSRYFSRPTDAQLKPPLTAGGAHLSLLGTVAGATKVTNGPSNVLRIRVAAAAAFSVITITSSAALANATVITDLNTQFAAAGLTTLVARLGNSGTPLQVLIENTDSSRSAYMEIDTTANGSNLNTALGFAAGGVILNALQAATVRAVVQPSPTTIDVSLATIVALSATPAVAGATMTNLTTAQQTAISNAVADAVAPKLIETGYALLSFDRGIISKLRSASFQPGGTRSGLPAGLAVAVVANDGSTVFTV